jgi:hypothetical protein
MRSLAPVLLLASLALVPGPRGPAPVAAQVAYDSPKGRVEVLGLRRWTLAMLQDSIRHYVRGQELYEAACMVTLRDSLHFAEASVVHFEMAPPGQPQRSFLAIKLIEPEQASSVQWDTRPRNEFSSLLPDYAPLILPVTDSTGAIWRGRISYWLQFSDSSDRERGLAHVRDTDRPDGQRVFAFLQAHRSEGDRVRAQKILTKDGFWVNRMAAVAVLSSFAAHDSTWLLLVRALRDPHEGVREAAEAVLRALPARAIDWRASVKDLRPLVGGTNLPAIETVFALLSRTDVDPALASPLLRNNAGWVLDHLGSEAPMASDIAHRLLVRLNGGRDLGRSRSAWESWARAL